jgi:shikimate 5-dehydrogenase
MKLGLLGYPITHSKSPDLYKKLIGDNLTSYDLFSFEEKKLIPPLSFFSGKLDGLNITSPYKEHFFNQVIIESQVVKKLGAINTIAFSPEGCYGTNTDLLAVTQILMKFKTLYQEIKVVLLGDGVMGKLSIIVLEDFCIPYVQLSRRISGNLSEIDLSVYHDEKFQTIIINSCSRDFIFKGNLNGDEVFWDYNYSFNAHENSLPNKVKVYYDGQELLHVQAQEAVSFWNKYLP